MFSKLLQIKNSKNFYKMKLIAQLIFCAGLLAACNNPQKSEDNKQPGELSTRNDGKKLDLPYPLESIPDWEKGDDNNVPIAMNFLKSYEVKDFSTLRGYLADTVNFTYDNGNFRGTKDQMVKFLKNFRDNRADVKIEMNDYETVKSKSKNQEYVSLWYKEKITDLQGKMDSAFVMDDYRIKGGKIASIDTKFRHLRTGTE